MRDDDIRDELQYHIDRQTEENVRAGMTPAEARRAAVRAFGGVSTIEEQCRDNQRGATLGTILADARIGLRLIRRYPSFAFTVIATLAIAVAACTTMFSIVDAVLLRPHGFPRPERLLTVYDSPDGTLRGAFSPPNFLDLAEQSRTLAGVTAYNEATWNLAGRETESVTGLRATAALFRTIGIAPRHGRGFHENEQDAAVVSHRLAMRQFGGAAAAIDKPLMLDGKRFTVVGVMPPAFRFPNDDVDVWTLLAFAPDIGSQRGAHYLRVVARVAPSATPEQAMRELDVIGKRLAAAFPRTNEGRTFIAQRRDAALVRDVRRGLLMLVGAVVLLALIACANIANLLLTRAAARAREWSVRNALGASRSRVLTQLLTEALILGLCGGGAGLLLTFGGVRLLAQAGPDNIPRIAEATVDVRALAIAIAASIVMSVLFGILPALTAARTSDASDLAGAGRIAGGGRASRIRGVMSIAQLALAVTLLAGAGLLVRSFQRVVGVDPGFDPRNVLAFDVSLPSVTYDGTARVNAFHDDLLQRLRATPGIASAGVTSHVPVRGGGFFSTFEIGGVEKDEWQAAVYVADEGYFRTLGVPLVSGRMFDGSERAGGQRVVLASATAAKKFWPGRDPSGIQLDFGASGGYEDYAGQIIGVVADVHHDGQESEVEPTFYIPLRQAGLDFSTYVVKTSIAPEAAIEAIRRQVAGVDPMVAVANVSTMEEELAESIARRRFQVFLLSFFAAAALLLATLGVYGVIAYSVTQRTREIGIRVALGASVAGVYRMILGQAMRLAGPAIALGIVTAIALRQVIATMLFGVSPTDATTLTFVACVVAGVSLLAACIPARRAATVDPTIALRYE
jgi:putative ABC transport system permease protein